MEKEKIRQEEEDLEFDEMCYNPSYKKKKKIDGKY